MALQNRKRFAVTLLLNTGRLVLSLVLVVSGFVKAVDPVGFMYKLQEYAGAFSVSVSDDWMLFFAIMLSATEFLLGVFLLMGIYRRVVPLLTFIMFLFFTPLTLYIMLSGSVDDCGCFGDAVEIDNDTTFYKNLVLLCLSFFVLWKRRRFTLCVSPRNRWMVVLFSLFYISILQGVSLSHLPVLDFRPYAVGNNLRELTQGTPAVYDVYYTCEKGGVQREFLSTELPDSGWTVLSNRAEEVSAGVEPVVGDFAIIDWEYDYDIAEDILLDTGYVCLLSIETTEEASVSRVDKVNDLYDYCFENDIPFYAATSSADSAVVLWRKRTGAEYPICWADAMLLRRMIRSNPGLVLLKDGVIVGKWNVSDIPDVEEFEASPTGMPDKLETTFNILRGPQFWVNWLVWPLVVILLLDSFAGFLRRRKSKSAAETGKAEEVDAAAEGK